MDVERNLLPFSYRYIFEVVTFVFLHGVEIIFFPLPSLFYPRQAESVLVVARERARAPTPPPHN